MGCGVKVCPGGKGFWDNNNVLKFVQRFLTYGLLRGRLVLSIRHRLYSLTTCIHVLSLLLAGCVSLGICSVHVSTSVRRRYVSQRPVAKTERINTQPLGPCLAHAELR